ncbi:hypothetical protein BAUCODRAFT_380125 [Baudoinia panamericana UAMH 10762]|uniref:Uncharacterized protein n=1 Tax=Baudoinia panamericana (strain UAMH 10762) TaxID=717646 RepID=M2NHG1_BAUPA|nr:uncharacterized protein BAUCODRAFT_380125 [Baudoinia panamericana UAMH 10762]EMC98784.1 hypothetical protein BAUCODRAFT_380125 [Baudoinia panamericana UAMH 10762]
MLRRSKLETATGNSDWQRAAVGEHMPRLGIRHGVAHCCQLWIGMCCQAYLPYTPSHRWYLRMPNQFHLCQIAVTAMVSRSSATSSTHTGSDTVPARTASSAFRRCRYASHALL